MLWTAACLCRLLFAAVSVVFRLFRIILPGDAGVRNGTGLVPVVRVIRPVIRLVIVIRVFEGFSRLCRFLQAL